MASLNKVFLIGNLTRDVELSYTPNGTAVAKIGLAVNEKYELDGQEKKEVCFIDITAWKKTAENCSQYLSKGSPVMIEGKLVFKQWEQSGFKRSKLEVTALNIQFLTKESSTKQIQNQSNEENIPY
jgi:single-strand DNA-binding protein